MANGVFDATLDVNNEIKVNNFDWSHANNLTTQIGRVTPVFCELVPARGSVRINPRFGLQFMPMVFPIQTRLRARMMFFKYPLRALWDGYRDFAISGSCAFTSLKCASCASLNSHSLALYISSICCIDRIVPYCCCN